MQKTSDRLDFHHLTFEQARDLEHCMKEMQEAYNQLIEDISKKQRIGPLWWITSIASRNIYQSPLFMRCAYLALLSRYIEQGVLFEQIICHDKALASVIKEYMLQKNISVQISFPKKSIVRYLKNVARAGYQGLGIWTKCHISLFSKKYHKKVTGGGITLIDMFILDQTINEQGYSERYFNGMLDFLSGEEKDKIFMFPHCVFSRKNFKKKYKAMMQSEYPKFWPDELFLKPKDYISAYVFLLNNFRHHYRDTDWMGFNIKMLLHAETKAVFQQNVTMGSYLRYKAIQRMSESGVKVKVLLDWYEGQPIDKATYLGFHTFYPDTRTIAYNGLIGNLDFNTYCIPIGIEQENHVFPKEYRVMGEAMIHPMKKYVRSLPVSAAPAFRYSHIWDKQYSIGQKIVIAVPLVPESKNGLLDCIGKSLCDGKMDGLEVVVKQHPADQSQLDQRLLDFKNVSVSSAPFPQLLADCAVLITGMSSTCLETVAGGIPVIIMGSRDTININIMPDEIPRSIWELCYDEDDLWVAIQKFTGMSEKQKNDLKCIGSRVRESYFEKPSAKSTRKLLGLSEEGVAVE